jgi:hypothetical protein
MSPGVVKRWKKNRFYRAKGRVGYNESGGPFAWLSVPVVDIVHWLCCVVARVLKINKKACECVNLKNWLSLPRLTVLVYDGFQLVCSP